MAAGDPMLAYFQQEKQTKLERYRRRNPYVKPGQIVFAGSSLMEQFPIEEFQLGLDLPLHIYNRGIGGFTTAEMLPVLDECICDLKPKYLFLNIGTNDLNGADLDLDGLMDRYGQILTCVRAKLPEVKIWLLAYYPVNPAAAEHIPFMRTALQHRTNARIQTANKAVRKLAAAHGAEFLDVNHVLTDENGDLKAEYTVEGMHFYPDGYAAVLEELLPLLRSLK